MHRLTVVTDPLRSARRGESPGQASHGPPHLRPLRRARWPPAASRLRAVGLISARSPNARRAAGKSSAAMYSSAESIFVSGFSGWIFVSVPKRFDPLLRRFIGGDAGEGCGKIRMRLGFPSLFQQPEPPDAVCGRQYIPWLPEPPPGSDPATFYWLQSPPHAPRCWHLVPTRPWASDRASTASRRLCTSRGMEPCFSLADRVLRAADQSPFSA